VPNFVVDTTWPKPYPNKWKIGGVTGLAVDKDDNVWVYDRPNDLTSLELQAELTPAIADCCTRPPSMIHIAGHDGPGYKDGEVIEYFDAPQGHGMAVDAQGFLYLGQNTVRKYDKTGKMLMEVPHIPENANGEPFTMPKIPERIPGLGGPGPVAGFIANQDAAIRAARGEVPAGGGGRGGRGGRGGAESSGPWKPSAFQMKYPPTTPMMIGGTEEIRTDDAANEIYIADNAFGGRIMVFSLDKFEFKRGWGAYGHKLSEISMNPADHAYTPGGPMAKEFVGHLTFNFSNDGLVYAADREGNRIHVTDKQGNFKQEIKMAENTGVGGSTGGVMFSNDPAQSLLYISDLTNNKVWFLDRKTGNVLGTLGQMGHNAGSFFGLHMEATDSKGNLYTGEVFYGERVQRFLLRP
jgi:sugar lactone lactonase YvrE